MNRPAENPAPSPAPAGEGSAAPSDFIRDIVARDVAEGRYPQIVTRFPPEPNGYLHLGHAKSICLNFGIAREFGGLCNLRMDDTNPAKEDVEYVESITADVRWLIEGWADPCLRVANPEALAAGDAAGAPFYASDYFQRLYDYAVELIRRGKAFVCDLSAGEIDECRRNGLASPFRERGVEENLALFERMRAGEFPEGSRTLRAKIDPAAPNIWLRDPLLYRIRHVAHHHTGGAWCIYPMYDYAHCLSDYVEGVTHSICTLEFEVHRALYDWVLGALDLPRALPHQYEFARLNLTYTVMSKRKLMALVDEGLVTGWDDPRMPTLSGIRRRGVPARALRDFAYNIGITKYDGLTEMDALDHAIRTDLNRHALRRMAVLRPVKVVLTNLPEDYYEELEAGNHPEDEAAGSRHLPFSRELYIEADDFQEIPPPKYFRLRPGGEVRLKYGYIIRCEEVVKAEAGNADGLPVGAIAELRCTVDLTTKRGGPNADRKVKGTIHWVSARHAIDAEVRLYDRLFSVPEPDAGDSAGDYKTHLNPQSLEILTGAKLEPSLAEAVAALSSDTALASGVSIASSTTLASNTTAPNATRCAQWERLGYFAPDPDSRPGRPVFNRTITLRDTWAKAQKK